MRYHLIYGSELLTTSTLATQTLVTEFLWAISCIILETPSSNCLQTTKFSTQKWLISNCSDLQTIPKVNPDESNVECNKFDWMMWKSFPSFEMWNWWNRERAFHTNTSNLVWSLLWQLSIVNRPNIHTPMDGYGILNVFHFSYSVRFKMQNAFANRNSTDKMENRERLSLAPYCRVHHLTANH